MTKVAAEFNKGKALLFTAQADSYIATFEQQWGVTITTESPLNICSAYVTNTTITSIPVTFTQSGNDYLFTIPASEAFIIEDLTIAVTGTPESTNGLGSYTLTPPVSAGSTIVLSSVDICNGLTADSAFSIGFADSSTATINCTAQNAGTFIAPTQPLSQLNGQNSAGNWVLTAYNGAVLSISSITLTNLQSNYAYSCSRDVMKALTNIPGYRYDSATQTVYYTEDVFDDNGNFKQITISRPINSLLFKK
jgi:hypothetical protein